MKQIERRLGFFPLYQSFDVSIFVLFPVGRADRMYLLLRGANDLSPRYGDFTLLCYQRKDKTDKLVYKVTLGVRPTQHRDRIRSLLDYLGSYAFLVATSGSGHEVDYSYFVMGRVSRFARQDLAAERDYVQYSYTPYTDTLNVWSLSALRDGHPREEGIAVYDLGTDPVTHTSLKPGEFYRRFGLPTAKAEE